MFDPRGRHTVAFREVNRHVEVAPNAVELPTDVGVGVPAVVVELAKLREPLRHAVFHALFVHPARSANLSRHLGLPGQVERHGLARAQGLGQLDFQYGAVFHEGHGGSIYFYVLNALPSPLGLRQFRDATSHPTVWIGNGARPHVHHASRLKGVEEQVPKHLVQRFRTVVDIRHGHGAAVPVV